MADVELATDEAGRSSIKDADADQAQLILALRGGDEAAFVSLVERHHAMLVRMARLYLPDCPDDVAHDVWIDLLRRLDCLDAGAPLRVTLLKILFDQVRRRAPSGEIPVPFAAHWDPAVDPASPSVDPSSFRSSDPWIGHWAVPVADWGQAPVDRLLSRQTRDRVDAAVASLPPAEREVIALRDVEGWTPAEAHNANRAYEVTITNLTTGQLLSPPVVAAHSADYAVFEVGEKASEGIWTVAEQGNPMKLAEQLRATPEVASVAVADGPVHRVGGPGPSTMTLRIESQGADRLSVAMMLGCTNDGFTGLSSVALSRSMVPVTYYGAAYDAGTERNNQLWSSMPDGCNALGPAPRDPDGQNDRDLTDDPIAMHPGIVPGVGDLGPELAWRQFAWNEAVVKITVQRVE